MAAVRLEKGEEPEQAARLLALEPAPFAVVLVGGADRMDDDALAAVRPFVERALAPLVEARAGTVLDGGTDSGVMRLMGRARAATRSGFPLVGVVPAAFAANGGPILEPNHTHFVLVPGSRWGDEGPWLAGLATALAAPERSFTALVNGGEVAWNDVADSLREGRPVVAVEGSGRTADALAAGIRGEQTDPRAAAMIASGLVHVCPPERDALEALVERLVPEP